MQTNDSGHVAGGKAEADTSAHTATPWFYQENSDVYTHIVRPEHSKGMIVVQLSQDKSGQSEADARFIVRACNAHQELVNALEFVVAELICANNAHGLTDDRCETLEAVKAARAALAKAGA